MSARSIAGHPRRRRLAAAVATTAAAALVLAGCGGDDDQDESVPLPTGPIEVTSSDEASTPADPSTGADTPAPEPADTATSAPAAPAALPTDAQAYAQALVDAWQAGDRAGAERLADPDEVDDLFDEDDLLGSPTFVRCEGAAGSSYCTWQGTGSEGPWTLQVRVGNEAVSQGQERAVTEIEVED